MSLANIREKLANGMRTIPGLTVSEYIPDVIILPLACISLKTSLPVEYDYTSQNTSWVYHFEIQLLINKGASVLTAQSELDEYIDPESDNCIKTAVEALDLTPDAAICRLMGAPTYGKATYGDTDFLAVYFQLDIQCIKQ